MADAKKYAEWIVANQDKKGTPEFEIVSKAYKQARQMSAVSEQQASDSTSQEAPQPAPQTQPQEKPQTFPLSNEMQGAAEEFRNLDKPEPSNVPETVGIAPSGFIGESLGFQGQITPRDRETASTVASYIPVVAASLMTNPGTLEAVVAPAVAETVGSIARGDTMGDTARNALIAGMTPGYKAKEAPGFVWRALTNTAYDAGQFLGAVFASESTKGFIEGKSFGDATKDALKMENYYVPAFLSPLSGSARALGERNSFLQQGAQKAKEAFDDFVAVNFKTTPAMADPAAYASIEEAIIAKNPKGEYAKNLEFLGEDVINRWAKSFRPAPEGVRIAQKLEPYMDDANAIKREETALVALEDTFARKSAELESARNLSPEATAKLREDIFASEMALVNQKARVNFFGQNPNATTPSGAAASTVQKRFTDQVTEIFNIRSKQAAEMYKKTGIPFDEKFIPIDDLVSAVKSATRKESGLFTETIIKSIEKAGGDSGVISINQMKQLREGFGYEFNSTNQAAIDTFDRISNLAYRAVTKRTSRITGKVYGKESQKAIGDVNEWWGKTANAANSKIIQKTLSQNPGEEVAKGLATDLSKGKFSRLQQYAELIQEISKYAPDVAEQGRRAITETVREGFFFSAMNKSRRVDLRKLYENLNGAYGYKKEMNSISSVLPIEQLGFGTAQQVRQIDSTFRRNGISSVTPEELDEFYANPMVKAAIRNGGDVSKLVRPASARIAFNRQVDGVLARAASGAAVESGEYRGLFEQAKRAGLDVDQAKEQIQILKNKNPIVNFFNEPGTKIGQKMDINGLVKVTEYIRNMPKSARRGFINSLREGNPQILKDVKARVTMDIMSKVVAAKQGSRLPYTVDTAAVYKLFNEGTRDAEHPIHILKDVIGEKEFRRFKKNLPSLTRLSAWAGGGINPNLTYDSKNILAGSAKGIMNGGPTTMVARSILGRLWDSVQGGRFHTAAAILDDTEIAAFILSGGKVLLPLNKQFLLRTPELRAEGLLPPLPIDQNAQDGR